MEAILVQITTQAPFVADDLRQIFADPDIARVASCLCSTTPMLVDISDYIPKMGYPGDANQQKQRVNYIIQRGGFHCIVVKSRSVTGLTALHDKEILNPVRPQRKNSAQMTIFMTPLELLCLFASVKTPQAMAYKRALWALCTACQVDHAKLLGKSCGEEARIKSEPADVDVGPVAAGLGECATDTLRELLDPLVVMCKDSFVTPIKRTASGMAARISELSQMGFTKVEHAGRVSDPRTLWKKLLATLQSKEGILYNVYTDPITGKNVRVYQLLAVMDLKDILEQMEVNDNETDSQWVADVLGAFRHSGPVV